MSMNALGFCYEPSATFFKKGVRGQSLEQFKTFDINSDRLQELTTDCKFQIRSSRTDNVSATNKEKNSWQFVEFVVCVE